MSAGTTTPSTPKVMVWTGRVLSTLVALLLTMSAAMKFSNSPDLVKGFQQFGYSMDLAAPLGIVELVCTALYVIPQTAVLGAILLTGYLGGATATHVRVNDPFFMPPVIGVVMWLGLFLRDARIRALIPIRRKP